MGYDNEVTLMREAKRLGLMTTPYVFNVDEAQAMAEVGVDIVVGACHTLLPLIPMLTDA